MDLIPVVSLNCDPYCDLIDTSWSVTISKRFGVDHTATVDIVADIITVYNNGTYLIFTNDVPFASEDVTSLVAFGIAHPTLQSTLELGVLVKL